MFYGDTVQSHSFVEGPFKLVTLNSVYGGQKGTGFFNF